jgi:hypothetical protein
MSLNPINDILSGTYESDVPKLHTSGRRESRITQTKGYYVPRPDGEPGTMPIKRDKPKIKGKKKLKRKANA